MKKHEILYILISLFIVLSCRKNKDYEKEILSLILTELSKDVRKEYFPMPPIPNSSEEEKLKVKLYNENQQKLKPVLILSEKFVSSNFFNSDNHINSKSIDNYNLSKTENKLVENLSKNKTEDKISIESLRIDTPIEVLFKEKIDYSKYRIIESIYVSEILIENNYACLYYQYGSYGVFQYGAVAILERENGVWHIKRKLFNWIT
ncbi:hypothetical protein [Wenyingzhuangia aestuarii]|uniref:hypothetical protein n=1 Tax=Wenyingzhuangia aestuarii TaxID=1647582 RepID=UPI00143AC07D|nr:hypothetical protein [Wenyingzhuangia aestuarii]NJB84244.1 hypothetical protein [Wenyingzhuangia aestuarii]